MVWERQTASSRSVQSSACLRHLPQLNIRMLSRMQWADVSLLWCHALLYRHTHWLSHGRRRGVCGIQRIWLQRPEWHRGFDVHHLPHQTVRSILQQPLWLPGEVWERVLQEHLAVKPNSKYMRNIEDKPTTNKVSKDTPSGATIRQWRRVHGRSREQHMCIETMSGFFSQCHSSYSVL